MQNGQLFDEATTNGELLDKMRSLTVSHSSHKELCAELDRRVAIAQFKTTAAQVRSARLQFAAVVAMFLTAIATMVAPLFAR